MRRTREGERKKRQKSSTALMDVCAWLLYSMVANRKDPVSWKEFGPPLRCEIHIDYGAP